MSAAAATVAQERDTPVIMIGAEHRHLVIVEHAEDPTLSDLVAWAQEVHDEALRQGAPPNAVVRGVKSVDVEWTTRAGE